MKWAIEIQYGIQDGHPSIIWSNKLSFFLMQRQYGILQRIIRQMYWFFLLKFNMASKMATQICMIKHYFGIFINIKQNGLCFSMHRNDFHRKICMLLWNSIWHPRWPPKYNMIKQTFHYFQCTDWRTKTSILWTDLQEHCSDRRTKKTIFVWVDLANITNFQQNIMHVYTKTNERKQWMPVYTKL